MIKKLILIIILLFELLLSMCQLTTTSISMTSFNQWKNSLDSLVSNKPKLIGRISSFPVANNFGWNRGPMWDDESIMSFICLSNADGNYQNPFNCSHFIMCSTGTAYLWECPPSTFYDPLTDMCAFTLGPDQAGACPWTYLWIGNQNPSCLTIAARSWWSPLSIPEDPRIRCGFGLRYCFRYQEVGFGQCPPRYGYSKAYKACLPRAVCFAMDMYFRL